MSEVLPFHFSGLDEFLLELIAFVDDVAGDLHLFLHHLL